MTIMPGRGTWTTLCGGMALVWLLVTGSTTAGARANEPAPAAAPAVQPAGGYVGADTCLMCHEDQSVAGTGHGRAAHPRSPAAANGCESCHGPGEAHVEGGGDRTKIRSFLTLGPRETSETCTTCHNRTEHNEWDAGRHAARNVTCTTCHSVHQPRSEHAQLKTETQVETCVQCHQAQVSKLQRSAHMPVREGKMECSSCHNPHGSQNVKMLREGHSVNESCASCHAEKRGPFLFEHAPGRESCVTCHDPHGSNNERMLVARLPMLCQRCHIATRHPGSIYDEAQLNVAKSNRIVGRGCVNCHSNIHGSNHPSGNRFVR
jgi:DmsE family decaheme c-type cytochrome